MSLLGGPDGARPRRRPFGRLPAAVAMTMTVAWAASRAFSGPASGQSGSVFSCLPLPPLRGSTSSLSLRGPFRCAVPLAVATGDAWRLQKSVGVAAHSGGSNEAASAEAITPREALRQELLAAIADFKVVQAKSGGEPKVDFGVKGGELDKKSRAPRNLLADGVFRSISPELEAAAERAVSLAKQIAPLTPNLRPLRGFGTAAGATDCPLHGAWRLLFTTAADATFSKNSTRGAATVSNVVDAAAGTVTNCVDFAIPQNGEPAPALESLRVHLTAKAETDDRLVLAFRFIKARITRIFGLSLGRRRLTLTLPVPGPLLTRIISFFTRQTPPQPFFQVLYLDDTLRIHETGQGNLFVQEKFTLA
ncbi:unnamed protein product [Polarella glacialis]|uniref:Plastid lipid-associated protein/fibrillin conserved domain-containing protein n=1 Tax=Polarella glacialis TaxID=89957 RepID=A0A813FNF6_POLGL|nr:unnamed protein product [Polarella glacialis]